MAFGVVSQYLSKRRMILVDTKYEMGKDEDGNILPIAAKVRTGQKIVRCKKMENL